MSQSEPDPTLVSEIARIRWQIQRNFEAIQRVAHDPCFSARHETINRRYTVIGKRGEQLAKLVGPEQALDMVNHINDVVYNQEEA